MVKLATAREIRRYGPQTYKNRFEYINSGLYTFSIFLIFAGLAGQIPGLSKGGLVILLIGLVIVAVVNLHDFFAHFLGVQYRIGFVRFDLQLGLVEFLVPILGFVGSVVEFVGVVLLLAQADTGYSDKLKRHATNCLIAGPLMWLIGSINNGCQIYERANGQTQILQSAVQVPFLMGSLLFFIGGFFNRRHAYGTDYQISPRIMAKSWTWLCMFGSLLFLIGGLFNILKVYKMQQGDGLRLEKLRGGAQERLNRIREVRDPIIIEETSGMRPPAVGFKPRPIPIIIEPTQ